MPEKYVIYSGVTYYRRLRGGYYVLHPVIDGCVDYDTAIKEHRLVYQLHHGITLDDDTVIHHINKDKLDNRIDNLMALSISEHARLHALEYDSSLDYTQPKKNYCVDCGAEIWPKATRCAKCYQINRRTKKHPTKEQLAEYIKTMNNTEIGKMCGVTSKAVEKWRKKYGLPSYNEQHGTNRGAHMHVVQ